MLEFYKTVNNKLVQESKVSEGCWINAVSPTPKEIGFLIEDLQIEKDFVNAALDEEESSRIESEEEQTLIIVDIPLAIRENEDVIAYTTTPMGIIITPTNIVTVCLNATSPVMDIANGMIKNIQTHLKTRFLLLILLRIAQSFLICLKQINKKFTFIEKTLSKTMRNQELLELMNLEKSLVYFSTSLKADEVTLEKILRGRVLKLYEEDEDLLEDVLIEIKQAVDMSNIYSRILSSTMESFASIINNNMNSAMKTLTIITAVLSIPNMVYGFYGMNVVGLPYPFVWFPFAISAVVSIICGLILFKVGKN